MSTLNLTLDTPSDAFLSRFPSLKRTLKKKKNWNKGVTLNLTLWRGKKKKEFSVFSSFASLTGF